MIEFTILEDGKLKDASLFRRFVVKLTSPELNLAEIHTREITVFEHTLLELTILQCATGKRHLFELALFECQVTQVLWPAITGDGLCGE